jgi:acyl carrier protein
MGVYNLEIENLHQGHLPAAPAHGDIGQILLELARRVAPGLPASQLDARELSLPDAGLTSMGAVRLMLAIEAAFNIAIPDAELTPANFANLDKVETLVARLRAQRAQ